MTQVFALVSATATLRTATSHEQSLRSNEPSRCLELSRTHLFELRSLMGSAPASTGCAIGPGQRRRLLKRCTWQTGSGTINTSPVAPCS